MQAPESVSLPPDQSAHMFYSHESFSQYVYEAESYRIFVFSFDGILYVNYKMLCVRPDFMDYTIISVNRSIKQSASLREFKESSGILDINNSFFKTLEADTLMASHSFLCVE